jgi:hypothetical protein
MSLQYSDPAREQDPHALPDAEVFELTALEAAEFEEDLILKYNHYRHEFRLANINSHVRTAMLEAIVTEQKIEGGWYYWFCMPGCLPDSDPIGPFPTHDAAVTALHEECT